MTPNPQTIAPRAPGAAGSEIRQQPLADEVIRHHLLAVLARRSDVKLVTIVGSAGFGKSTLIAQALRRSATAPRGIDVAHRCGAGDQDAAELTCHLLDLLQSRAPVPETTSAMAAVLTTAIATHAPIDVTIMLDDVHVLGESSSAVELLAATLSDLPTNGHLVLAGRQLPPLPVARLRASDVLLELGPEQLAFSRDELGELASAYGCDVDDLDSVAGWPALARLQLAVGHRAAMDFLWEELVGQIDGDVRSALALLVMMGGAQPSELDSLAAGSAAHVTELRALPMVASHADGTLRPHELWAGMLDRLVGPDERRQPAGVVAAWLARRGRIDDALRLALDGDDLDQACAVVLVALQDGTALIDAALARRWLGLFPEESHERPEVMLLRGITLRLDHGLEHGADLVATALDQFNEAGRTDGEAVAMIEMVHRLWQQGDRESLADLHDRATRVAEESGTTGLSQTIANIDVTLADPSGDAAGALAMLDAIDLGEAGPGYSALIQRWRSSLLVLLGRTGEAVEAADRATHERHHGRGADLVFNHAVACWQDGDPHLILALRSQWEAVSAPTARDRFFGLVYRAILGASIGAAHPVDLSELLAAGSGHGRDRAYAVVAVAASQVALGDGMAARETIEKAIDRWGIDDPLALGEYRRFSSITAALSPALAATFEREDLGRQQQRRLALASILVEMRRDGLADPSAISPPQLVTGFPLRWVVELAIRAHGRHESWSVAVAAYLADVLPEPSSGLLAEVGRDIGMTEPAAQLVALVPRPPSSDLTVSALGPLAVSRDGDPVDPPELRRARVRELLALMILRDGVSREAAMLALWPNLDATKARNNLRVTLSHLRRLIEPDRGPLQPSYLLQEGQDTIRLRRCDQLDVDLWTVRDLVAAARHDEDKGRLGSALDAYGVVAGRWRGEVFADLRYVDHIGPELIEVESLLVDVVCRYGELLLASRRPGDAIAAAARVLTHDPAAERAHRIIIGGHIAHGDNGAATSALGECRSALAAMGLAPSEETLMMERSLAPARH